jgi:hypothetical protein
MQNVGNGSTTKTILEFLKAEGPATLYSNVVAFRYVRELAFNHSIGIDKLVNKNFKSVDADIPLVAWRYN